MHKHCGNIGQKGIIENSQRERDRQGVYNQKEREREKKNKEGGKVQKEFRVTSREKKRRSCKNRSTQVGKSLTVLYSIGIQG